jgi:aminoglycoside 3-N-acetyltransferase
MEELNYAEYLDGIGIKKGDILDVASDLMSVMMYCRRKKLRFVPNHLLDALQEMVGEEGTVMVRTFTWDFCHDTPFDIKESPSRSGSLGDVAMKREDFKRTQHPIYSWMVWGKYQEELCAMTNSSAFGIDTPFDFLDKKHGKQLVIGNLTTTACTQIHHCEALAEVPYRLDKVFKGEYVDEKGSRSMREYSMHVRPLNLSVSNEVTNTTEFGDMLKEKGIYIHKMYDDKVECSAILLHEMTECLVEDLKEEGKWVVSIEGCAGYKAAGVSWDSLKYY